MTESSARVTAYSRLEPANSLDFFPTPPWATRALFMHVLGSRGFRDLIVDEPACGKGHMTYVLQDYFGTVRPSDIFDYGIGAEIHDFLAPGAWRPHQAAPHWIITNPPFSKVALAFMRRALCVAAHGVAMIVPNRYIEGVDRYQQIYRPHRPHTVAHFVERVPMHKGRWVADGDTFTAYSWIVWRTDRQVKRTDTIWIPPSRKLLHFQRDVDHFAGGLTQLGGVLS